MTGGQLGMFVAVCFFAVLAAITIVLMAVFPDRGLPRPRDCVCLICGWQGRTLVSDKVRPYCRCGNHLTVLP